jgi:WD40 repeat protein
MTLDRQRAVQVDSHFVVLGKTMRSTQTPSTYRAFISYSHAVDGKLAPEIQNSLRAFAKPWYALRSIKVFRDTTSLSASPALWPSIEKALSDSEWLLLFASDVAAQSHWVQKEIAWWLNNRSTDRVLIILTEGDIVWDDEKSDFDRQRTTALPLGVIGNRWQAEPLWVDMRWAKDPSTLTLRHSQFRAAILDLAAALLGKPKDELDGEDVRQHRCTKRLATGAAFGLVLLTISSVAASIIANQQRKAAVSRELSARSTVGLPFDPATSLALSLKALDVKPTDEARQSLQRALVEAHGRVVLGGHGGAVRSARFSNDGKLAITGGDDGTARVWDASSGKCLVELDTHGVPIEHADFTPDGKTAMTVTHGGALQEWEVASGKLSRQIGGGSDSDNVGDSVLSPDLRLLFTGYSDGTAEIWDVAGGERVAAFRAGAEPAYGAIFSPDSRVVAIPRTGSVMLWPIDKSAREVVLAHDQRDYRDLAFSPDGRLVLAVSGAPHTRQQEHVVTIWNVATHRKERELRGHHEAVLSASFSPDGSQVLTASADQSARIWEVSTGQIVQILEGHTDEVVDAHFSSDGALIVTASRDNTARVWEASTGKVFAVLHGHGEWKTPRRGLIPKRCLTSAVFSSDDRLVISAGGDGTARIWDSAAGVPALTLKGHGEPLGSAVFDPSGRYVLTSGGPNVVSDVPDRRPKVPSPAMWDASNGTLMFELPPERGTTLNAQYSPDGTWILTSGGLSSARIWDTASGSLRAELPSHGEAVRNAAISTDGKLAVLASGNNLLVYERGSVKLVCTIETGMKAPERPAFDRDGTLILATSGPDKIARTWDSRTCHQLSTLKHSDWMVEPFSAPTASLLLLRLATAVRVYGMPRPAHGSGAWYTVTGLIGSHLIRMVPCWQPRVETTKRESGMFPLAICG